MRKIGFAMLALGLLAGCGGREDEGTLTADERQRLENIAERLDKEIPFPAEAETEESTEAEAAPTENLLN